MCSLIVFCFSLQGQDKVTIEGKVYIPKGGLNSGGIMVVNKNTGVGLFAELDGTFKITMKRKDTLLVSSTGYKTIYTTVLDSVKKNQLQYGLYT